MWHKQRRTGEPSPRPPDPQTSAPAEWGDAPHPPSRPTARIKPRAGGVGRAVRYGLHLAFEGFEDRTGQESGGLEEATFHQSSPSCAVP